MLEEYQEVEDSKDDMAKIPLLSREDIGRQARKIVNKECNIKDIPALYHEAFTNEIAYMRMIFDIKDMPEELYRELELEDLYDDLMDAVRTSSEYLNKE